MRASGNASGGLGARRICGRVAAAPGGGPSRPAQGVFRLPVSGKVLKPKRDQRLPHLHCGNGAGASTSPGWRVGESLGTPAFPLPLPAGTHGDRAHLGAGAPGNTRRPRPPGCSREGRWQAALAVGASLRTVESATHMIIKITIQMGGGWHRNKEVGEPGRNKTATVKDNNKGRFANNGDRKGSSVNNLGIFDSLFGKKMKFRCTSYIIHQK